LALAVNTIAEITCLKANFNHRVIGCDVSTSVRLCKADDNYISNWLKKSMHKFKSH